MPITPAWGQSVLNIVPGTMSLGLLGSSMGTMNSMWDVKKSPAKKSKSMVKGFTDIMIGVPLIGATSTMISGL